MGRADRRHQAGGVRAGQGVVRLQVASAVVLMLACGGGIPTRMLGPLREVTVVTEHWDMVDSILVGVLQRPVLTPQPEPEFRLRRARSDRFDTYSRFRIVMLIGTVDDTLVRQVLGSRADSLPEAGVGLFRLPNPWQQGQTGLVLACREPGLLKQGLAAYAGRIRRTLEEVVIEQMRQAVYVEGADRQASDRLEEKYSFSVEVPRRWQVREEFADRGFVYLFAHYPDRSVFVYWADSTRPLEPESLAALRDLVTGRFYDGDSIDAEFTCVDTVEFMARPAVRLRGVWKNDRETIGGPFVTYAFNHQGRFYMVDGLVFDPGRKKLDHLLQVEAVVRSFTPARSSP